MAPRLPYGSMSAPQQRPLQQRGCTSAADPTPASSPADPEALAQQHCANQSVCRIHQPLKRKILGAKLSRLAKQQPTVSQTTAARSHVTNSAAAYGFTSQCSLQHPAAKSITAAANDIASIASHCNSQPPDCSPAAATRSHLAAAPLSCSPRLSSSCTPEPRSAAQPAVAHEQLHLQQPHITRLQVTQQHLQQLHLLQRPTPPSTSYQQQSNHQLRDQR
ncbi:unnamed protein product [Polarella glacialis]|uniref:Uncharacterized protein n=1 Tax=Polarella glacialis TaxID=89957 RepID=A0A813JBJ3_POLGL|nr:unnamed protein product [Polarella glacialis]